MIGIITQINRSVDDFGQNETREWSKLMRYGLSAFSAVALAPPDLSAGFCWGERRIVRPLATVAWRELLLTRRPIE
jgi:hypothetical protein